MDKTFLIGGNPEPFAKQLLEELGYEPTSETSPSRVNFLHSAPGSPKEYWNVECDIQSIVSVDSKRPIVFKDNLHHHLRNTKYIAPTQSFETFRYKEGIFIIRPSGRGWYAGKGITIVSNMEEFKEAKKEYDKILKDNKNTKVIVSKLFRNPLLLDKYKFHLRMYLGVRCDHESHHFLFANIGEILTAKLPYVKKDWQNKDIHDTHLGSSKKDLFFPDDFEPKDMLSSIYNQLDHLACYLKSITKIRPYPTSKTAYEIFGADLMITRKGNVKLIEINDKISYEMKDRQDPRVISFFNKLKEWEIKEIIGPLIKS